MARIRTIKPEFWASESLGTRLPGPDGRQARLLFISLWNHAEDHGVCRAAPALLRSVAFPYDEDVTTADVSRWLGMLEAARFIVRYERDGSSYLWVRAFDEHQKIDRKSKTSLPEPSNQEKQSGVPAFNTVPSPRRALDEPSLQEGKGREGKGETTLSSGDDGPEELPDATDDAHPVAQPPLFAVPTEPEKPTERPEDLQALWNSEAHPNLPRWRELTDSRRRKATTRLRERPLSEWREIVRRINASPFLRGEQGQWRASPDWLLQPDAAVKVLEGKYDSAHGSAAAIPPKPTKFIEM